MINVIIIRKWKWMEMKLLWTKKKTKITTFWQKPNTLSFVINFDYIIFKQYLLWWSCNQLFYLLAKIIILRAVTIKTCRKSIYTFLLKIVFCVRWPWKYHMKLADLNIISQSNSIRVVFGRNATKDISNNNYTKFHLPTKEPNYLRQSWIKSHATLT